MKRVEVMPERTREWVEVPYGPLTELDNDTPEGEMASADRTFSVDDTVTWKEANAVVTYGPLAQSGMLVIRFDNTGGETAVAASTLTHRAEFEPGQTALWEGEDRVTILSGPHSTPRGTRMYGVQTEETGELEYAPAADLEVAP